MKPKELGYHGEDLAARFLQGKGYEIVERNFTIRGGEIDLVAHKGEETVFVEVKIRKGNLFGEGDESLNFWKKRRLVHTIESYFLKHRISQDEADYRVDLVEIQLGSSEVAQPKITHYEDIEL